jgi:hypothetical protein
VICRQFLGNTRQRGAEPLEKHWVKVKHRKHPAMSRVMGAFG